MAYSYGDHFDKWWLEVHKSNLYIWTIISRNVLSDLHSTLKVSYWHLNVSDLLEIQKKTFIQLFWEQKINFVNKLDCEPLIFSEKHATSWKQVKYGSIHLEPGFYLILLGSGFPCTSYFILLNNISISQYSWSNGCLAHWLEFCLTVQESQARVFS